jgi:hypothetical protein
VLPAILYLPRGFATAGFLAVALPILLVTTRLFLYSSTCLLHQAWKTHDDLMNYLMDTTNNSNPEVSAVVTESSWLLDDNNNNNQPSLELPAHWVWHVLKESLSSSQW